MKTTRKHLITLAFLIMGMMSGNLLAQNTNKRPMGITLRWDVKDDPSDWEEYDHWEQYLFHYDDEGRVVGLDWNNSEGESSSLGGFIYQLPSSISSSDGSFQAALQDGRIVNLQVPKYDDSDNIQFDYDSYGQLISMDDDYLRLEWENGDIATAIFYDDEYWHFTYSDDTAHPLVHWLTSFFDEDFLFSGLLYNYFGATPRHLISHLHITDEYGGGDVEDFDYRYTRNDDGDVIAVDIVYIEDEWEEDEICRMEFSWETVDAVHSVDASSYPQKFYSLDGRRLTKAGKGVFIEQTKDGTFHKVVHK